MKGMNGRRRVIGMVAAREIAAGVEPAQWKGKAAARGGESGS